MMDAIRSLPSWVLDSFKFGISLQLKMAQILASFFHGVSTEIFDKGFLYPLTGKVGGAKSEMGVQKAGLNLGSEI